MHVYSRWNKIVIAGLVLSVACVTAFNWLVDPYEIFHTNVFRHGAPMNDRFNKVAHLLQNKGEYNTLIMGSSVMGIYDPAWLQEVQPGKRAYNASFLGGFPVDAHKVLATITTDGAKVNEVLMGIDLFQFMQSEDSSGPSRRHHYRITRDSPWSFYADYLFASSLWHGWVKWNDSLSRIPGIEFDVSSSGRYFLRQQDLEIESDPDRYIKKHFPAMKTGPRDERKGLWIDSRFAELKAFVEWARENRIKTTFFLQPSNHLLRDNLPAGAIDDFRKRVFAITGVIPDFTQTKEITDNDRLFYDPKHYVPAVAIEIVKQTYAAGPR